MKAILHDKYGSPDVLEYNEVATPAPRDDEVLIRILAASINPLDWHTLRGSPFMLRVTSGILKPKHRILGVDLAGRVEAVGKNARRFQPGQEIFGTSKLGALAEYVCVTQDRILAKPAHLTFEQAAAVPVAALTALQGLRDKGRIRPAQKVLINGASGGVGSFAVQIAKSFGAEVTGVCSTGNLEMVRTIGADHVIDYTQEDFTRNGQCHDVIFDAAAYRSILDCKRCLAPKGRYVMVGGSGARMIQLLLLGPGISMIGNQTFRFMIAKVIQRDLLVLKELLEAGRIAPVIDRLYPLGEAADALRYLEEGHAKGKVVITM